MGYIRAHPQGCELFRKFNYGPPIAIDEPLLNDKDSSLSASKFHSDGHVTGNTRWLVLGVKRGQQI